MSEESNNQTPAIPPHVNMNTATNELTTTMPADGTGICLTDSADEGVSASTTTTVTPAIAIPPPTPLFSTATPVVSLSEGNYFNNYHHHHHHYDVTRESGLDSAPTSLRRLQKTDSSNSLPDDGILAAIANLEEIPMVHAVSFIDDHHHHHHQHYHQQQQHDMVISSSSLVSTMTPSTTADHPSSQHSLMMMQVFSDDQDEDEENRHGRQVFAGTILSHDDTMATATVTDLSTTTTTTVTALQFVSATSVTTTTTRTLSPSVNSSNNNNNISTLVPTSSALLSSPPPPWMCMNGSTVLPLSHLANVSHVELDSPDPEQQQQMPPLQQHEQALQANAPLATTFTFPYCGGGGGMGGWKRRSIAITACLALVFAAAIFVTGFGVATNLFHRHDNGNKNSFIHGSEDEYNGTIGHSPSPSPTNNNNSSNNNTSRQPLATPSISPTLNAPTLAPFPTTPSPLAPTHHHPTFALGCNITSSHVFHNTFGFGILGNSTLDNCICYCRGRVEAFFQDFCYCGRSRKPGRTLTPISFPTYPPAVANSPSSTPPPPASSPSSSPATTNAPTIPPSVFLHMVTKSPTSAVLSASPSEGPSVRSNPLTNISNSSNTSSSSSTPTGPTQVPSVSSHRSHAPTLLAGRPTVSPTLLTPVLSTTVGPTITSTKFTNHPSQSMAPTT